MRQAIRNGNVGIAAGALVLAVDVFLFASGRTSEAALQAGGLFGLFVSVAVAVGLQERARRRRDRSQ
jgi:hypothetical protein